MASCDGKIEDVLAQLGELTAVNTAMLAGVNALTDSIGSLRELTAQLLDAVTEEPGGELADEIHALVVAVNKVSDGVSGLPDQFEKIALEKGMAVPAKA